MATTPGQNPPGGGAVSGAGGPKSAGVTASGDPVNLPGQYPGSIFGVAIPQGTGAPGTAGAGGSADPVNQPGQLTEGISGTGPADTANTGAPGSAGSGMDSGGGADSVTYTEPGSFLSGTNTEASVRDDISGTSDWTQAHDGSYGGSLNLPGVDGNQPTPNSGPFQPGSGRVLRGGYRKGNR
jgi:hypothetical protein